MKYEPILKVKIKKFADDFGYGELYSGFSSYFSDAVNTEEFTELCAIQSVAGISPR